MTPAGVETSALLTELVASVIKRKDKSRKMQRKSLSSPSAVRGALALLLIICLVECTTEQRINNRGSKSSNLIQKVNGWRSQRGGSCLSYGHSCWGAHGKRSGKTPASASDWYITRILRRMAVNNEMNNSKNLESRNNGDIYRLDVDDSPNKFAVEGEVTNEMGSRVQEGKPMLDDELLSNMKFWQIMKAAAEDN